MVCSFVLLEIYASANWLTLVFSWHLPSSATAGGRKPYKEKVFFEKDWKFRDAGKGRTEILPADNYEFPFDVILEGSLPESVEGLHDTWVTYRFKAEIGRKYARDIIIRKPVRIVRTLDPSALELAHAMVSTPRFCGPNYLLSTNCIPVSGKYLAKQGRIFY